jgi:ankyrin repeat protein
MRTICSALLLFLVVGCSTAQMKVDPALFAAVKADNAGEVERLLAGGGDAKAGSPLGWGAASSGSVRSAKVLIAHGADVNALDQSGFAPLHYAAYYSQPEVAELLIRSGADVNVRSEGGWTALQKALEQLAFLPPKAAAPESLVATTNALVGLLLSSGAQVNLGTSDGMLPIHSAALTGQKSLVQQLLERGADVNAKSKAGVTPLYLAAKKDCADVAELLIARGASLNAKTKSGYTPLTIAASEGSAGAAKVLLEHGADATINDGAGRTPLWWACKGMMARHTVESSSPASDQLRKKMSGPALAELRKSLDFSRGLHGEVSLLLVRHGADHRIEIEGSKPLGVAAMVGDRALAEALIGAGADVNTVSKDAVETPLHSAIAEGHNAVAELLINSGANVNAGNRSQRTPLHYSAFFLHDKKLAELLIQRGANVNAKDKEGQTPLALASRAGNSEVAEVLRQHGGK